MAASKLNKVLYTDITRLKLLDKDSAEVRFRLKQSPFTDSEDDDGQAAAQKQGEYVVTGEIFPKSEIFRERAYLIEMKLTNSFPMAPPEVRFLTPIYHPNVGRDGESSFDIQRKNENIFSGTFCNALLLVDGDWTPDKSLIHVLKAVVKHIDYPDVNHSVSVG
jgi:ubiquitin-protein ligase